MDKSTAQAVAKEVQISVDYIVREEYEMILLKEIMESEFGSSLVFKGGTALRLAYNSPRFSEDLDFNLISEIDGEKFLTFLKKVSKKYPNIMGVESREKFYTVFALVRIEVEYLGRPFSIKIEVSKRDVGWIQNKDYSDKLIHSAVAPLNVLARVAGLEAIMSEKKDALKNRKVARDVFDYWYLHQLLKKEIKPDFTGFDREAAISELHKLLPRTYWRVVDLWLE